MLECCSQIIDRNDMGRPSFHFPWLLRVLYAYKQAGLPDVTMFSFESEFEIALAAASLQLQASAWLVKGQMLLDQGQKADLSRSAFKRSLKLFLTVGNPVEAARVKLNLARADAYGQTRCFKAAARWGFCRAPSVWATRMAQRSSTAADHCVEFFCHSGTLWPQRARGAQHSTDKETGGYLSALAHQPLPQSACGTGGSILCGQWRNPSIGTYQPLSRAI